MTTLVMAKVPWWVWLVPASMAAFFFASPYRYAGHTFIEGVLNTELGTGADLVMVALVVAVAAGIKIYEWRQDDRPWIPDE